MTDEEEVTVEDHNMYGDEPGHHYEGVTVTVRKFMDGSYRCAIIAKSGSTREGGRVDPTDKEETVLRGSEGDIKQEANLVLSEEYLPYFYRAFNKAIDQLEGED
jgi:hypothetical protein